MLRIFIYRKIQRTRPGLNPRTREPEASMRTTRPPKPSGLSVNMSAVLNVTTCSVVYMDQRFRDTWCPHLLNSIATVLALRKYLSETLAYFGLNVQRYIPSNSSFRTNRRKSLRYYSLVCRLHGEHWRLSQLRCCLFNLLAPEFYI
jgi:hypothetical protein